MALDLVSELERHSRKSYGLLSFDGTIELNAFALLDITVRHGLSAGGLPRHHNDPVETGCSSLRLSQHNLCWRRRRSAGSRRLTSGELMQRLNEQGESGSPRPNEVAVSGTRQSDKTRSVSRCSRGLGEPFAHPRGDNPVVDAVEKHCWDAEGQVPKRSRDRQARSAIGPVPTDEFSDCARCVAGLENEIEVNDARKRDRAVENETRRPARCSWAELRSRRCPHRKMASRRVAAHNQRPAVNRKFRHKIDGARNVLEGFRDASAPANAPVLNVPDGETHPSQPVHHRSGDGLGIARSPRPTVNQDNQRNRASWIPWHRQVADLLAQSAITDPATSHVARYRAPERSGAPRPITSSSAVLRATTLRRTWAALPLARGRATEMPAQATAASTQIVDSECSLSTDTRVDERSRQ